MANLQTPPSSCDGETSLGAEGKSAALSFEEVLARLKTVVDRLDGSDLSLEDSLRAFEEGVRLSRSGLSMLDAAEHRVEMLLRGDDGGPKLEPVAVSNGTLPSGTMGNGK